MILLIFNFENIIFQKKGKWNYVYTLKLPFPVHQLVQYERKEIDITRFTSHNILSIYYEK
jgi:hypothetical protein